ncbi:sulfatase [Halioxenophilus sp. WMMB6]|uniref:sulfatase family protein n=1 Tax=Halioxenophilus sp. WMMB6 TaxID=3073815 RepID=UPI00295F32D1|nr:sulfatase-like hydrolase/transferase [Halioxenophilus sp. WMMB6]
MRRYGWPWGLLLTAVLLQAGCGPKQSTPTGSDEARPNVLLLYLDDFGFNDMGANGGPGPLPTTNLDKFAHQSVRFTRHYTESTCSPSRAALLTGRYPARAGYTPDGPGLSQQVQTLPRELKRLGYTTHHVGKWHLGHASLQAWPDAVGFDTWFGFLSQWLLTEPEQYPYRETMFSQPTYQNPWLNDNSHKAEHYTGHLSEIITEHTIGLIEQHAGDDQPWFINHWFYQPHTPIQPAPIYAAKYPNTPEGRYLAVLEQLDSNVGKILSTLEASGQSHNTLVIIASDNGGTNKQRDNNWPFYGHKAQYFEGGIRTPLMIRWPDGRWAGQVVEDTVTVMDLMPTILHAAHGVAREPIDGLDLTSRLATGRALPARTLMWEHRIQERYIFSVLSAEGHWRVVTPLLGGPPRNDNLPETTGVVLNDLIKEPRGETDVTAQAPQEVVALMAQYQQWFTTVHQLNLYFQEGDGRGVGVMSGDDLQRTPGNGAITYAFAVQGKSQGDVGTIMSLIEQAGVWRVDYHPQDQRLSIHLQENGFEVPFSLNDQCQSIVLAGVMDRRFNNWRSSESRISLNVYINGALAGNFSKPGYLATGEAVAEPTVIGGYGSGEREFNGFIGPVHVYNAPASNSNYLKPMQLHRELCQTP